MGHHDHQQHHHAPSHAAVLDLDGEVLASHLEAILDRAPGRRLSVDATRTLSN